MTSVDTLTPPAQVAAPSVGDGSPRERPRSPAPGAGRLASVPCRNGHPRHHLPLSVVQVGESTWDAGQRFQCERGELASIELVLEGTIRLFQDEREALIATGQVFVLRPGARQRYNAVAGPVRKWHLVLDGPIAEQLVATLPDHIAPTDPAGVMVAFAELVQLFRDVPADHHVRASTIAYQLLVKLSLAQQGGTSAAMFPPPVVAALRILETSGARDLDVRQVARQVGTSVSHLHRLFKDALGTSPLRYARERLIAQAKDALSNSTLSCQAIAKRLGYDDPLYFSAVFKRMTGVSPREYRKRHR